MEKTKISHGISDFASNNWTGQVYEATAQEFPWRCHGIRWLHGDKSLQWGVQQSAFHCESFNFLWQWKPWCHFWCLQDVCRNLKVYGRVEDFLFLPVFGWVTPAANRKMLVVAGTCASLVFHRADMVLVGCRRPEFDLRTAQTHATTLLGFLL